MKIYKPSLIRRPAADYRVNEAIELIILQKIQLY